MSRASIIFIIVLVLVGAGATFWIMWPVIQAAQHKVAVAKADTVVAKTQTEQSEKVNAVQDKVQTKIIRIRVPVERAAAQITAAPGVDPSSAFFAGVCGSGLYDGSPHCNGANGGPG
jgi:flagellar basal body-associated protein FliL